MTKKNKIIAFQGVPGAHSDMACRENYPYMDTIACPSFDDAFKAVEDGKADLCLVPIENSHAGRVAEIHNILPKTKLHIVAEHFQEVEHCLMAAPGATMKSVKEVYSHPQGLMQCRKYIHKKKLEQYPYSNTAIAARDVARWKDDSKCAIASSLAAELYELEILERNIQDAKDNTTLFIAMAKEPADPDPEHNEVITSLFFTARNIPAALYKALGGFATNHVNLIKVESYIPSGQSRTADFFVSFEGNPHQRHVQLAIEELGFFCKKVKVLGVYPADTSRKKD